MLYAIELPLRKHALEDALFLALEREKAINRLGIREY